MVGVSIHEGGQTTTSLNLYSYSTMNSVTSMHKGKDKECNQIFEHFLSLTQTKSKHRDKVSTSWTGCHTGLFKLTYQVSEMSQTVTTPSTGT